MGAFVTKIARRRELVRANMLSMRVQSLAKRYEVSCVYIRRTRDRSSLRAIVLNGERCDVEEVVKPVVRRVEPSSYILRGGSLEMEVPVKSYTPNPNS